MSAPSLDQKKVAAFAELLAGRPCIQAEAYRGAGISESSAKRLLKDEGFQAQVRAMRLRYGGIGRDARGVVEDLLEATNDDGEPNFLARRMGAELALKYRDVLDVDVDDLDEETLPAGVVRVYPSQYDETETASMVGGEGETPALADLVPPPIPDGGVEGATVIASTSLLDAADSEAGTEGLRLAGLGPVRDPFVDD